MEHKMCTQVEGMVRKAHNKENVEGTNSVEGIVMRCHWEKEPSNGVMVQLIVIAKELVLVS
jgi:hypothetical protein